MKNERPWKIGEVFPAVNWPNNLCSSGTAVLMLGLIAAFRVRVIIEIGTWMGFTSQVLGYGLRAMGGGTLISCDYVQNCCDKSKAMLEGVEGVTHRVICNYSDRVNWPAELAAVGETQACLVYVDGDHSYDGALKDMLLTAPVVRPGGLMVCHDYNHVRPEFANATRAIDDFTKECRWPRIVTPFLPSCNEIGAAVLQRPSAS